MEVTQSEHPHFVQEVEMKAEAERNAIVKPMESMEKMVARVKAEVMMGECLKA
jgi:hypothetical protein